MVNRKAYPRYIANDFTELLTLQQEPQQLLKDTLDSIISDLAPLIEDDDENGGSEIDNVKLSGFWSGPTGLAYLFLHVSSQYPKLRIRDRDCLTWAKRYMTRSTATTISGQPATNIGTDRCGVACESLAYKALEACLYPQDLDLVASVVASIFPATAVVDRSPESMHQYPDELLYGRSGTLYLLRMMRHWVPGAANLVAPAIRAVSEAILAAGDSGSGLLRWTWHGKPYLGAVHGEIGILTQLVLTTPALAPQVEDKLVELLDSQLADGHWPSSSFVAAEGGSTAHHHHREPLVQFCHGAPGFLHSLVALKPYYPSLEAKIDVAIGKGRRAVWEKGLLVKEPSLCHGIFGNALALGPGPRRKHFLSMATPQKMTELVQWFSENSSDHTDDDRQLFAAANYGNRYAILAGYLPSAAWAWLVTATGAPGLFCYSDI